ncbi:MAG: sporulation initiation factor Spo0A C-terminal domain-containing protein [Clostridia bacterium]|nr:sporulation initiation factor Spo0A C-terminal domain-containing protein [Clostridia bacterium]
MNENHELKEIIEVTLRRLGINANYRGYRPLCIAIEMVIEDEECLRDIIRRVYIPVAEQLHCNPHTIERNIRTVIARMWKEKKSRYQALTESSDSLYPTSKQFIDAIAFRIRCAYSAKRR